MSRVVIEDRQDPFIQRATYAVLVSSALDVDSRQDKREKELDGQEAKVELRSRSRRSCCRHKLRESGTPVAIRTNELASV